MVSIENVIISYKKENMIYIIENLMMLVQGGKFMNKNEINQFIEEMEEIGDKWTPEEVESVYGNKKLEDALEDRKGAIGIFCDIVDKVINK